MRDDANQSMGHTFHWSTDNFKERTAAASLEVVDTAAVPRRHDPCALKTDHGLVQDC